MAENNSSAPLKTAEGAYPALPDPVDHLAEADGFNVIGSVDVYTAEQMHAYAAQAVAAQAAPAAVAWENFPSYLIDHCEGDEITEEGLQHALAAMLANPQYSAATPALSATEDFSAGDLAEARMNYTEAYAGAREDLSIWKRRALEAERDLRTERETSARLVAAINAENGPSHLGEAVALEQAEPLIVPLNEHGIAPCPLCGSKSKHVKSGESGGHRILCWSDTCECSSGYFFDKEAAISSWNSRTTEGK